MLKHLRVFRFYEVLTLFYLGIIIVVMKGKTKNKKREGGLASVKHELTDIWDRGGSIYKHFFEFRKSIPTPEVLNNAIFDYVEECQKANLIPTELGFCIFFGIKRSDLKKEPYINEPYASILDRLRMIIEEFWIQKGLTTKNSVFHIFAMKNLFSENWKDKKEIDDNKNISIKLINFNELNKLEHQDNIITLSSDDVITNDEY